MVRETGRDGDGVKQATMAEKPWKGHAAAPPDHC